MWALNQLHSIYLAAARAPLGLTSRPADRADSQSVLVDLALEPRQQGVANDGRVLQLEVVVLAKAKEQSVSDGRVQRVFQVDLLDTRCLSGKAPGLVGLVLPPEGDQSGSLRSVVPGFLDLVHDGSLNLALGVDEVGELRSRATIRHHPLHKPRVDLLQPEFSLELRIPHGW